MDTLLPMKSAELRHYAELHYQFHSAIVAMSGNALLVRMFERLNLRSSHMFLQSMDDAKAATTRREHYRILELLKTRNPAGERFVIGHLWRTKLRAASRTASQIAVEDTAWAGQESGDKA
jgi:DNA-binding GntR family transcriptional regulator